jgi:hypothetical protein
MTDTSTMRAKTEQLQAQFICPIWAVWFGSSVKLYFTAYHAEQMMRALRSNGTEAHCFATRPQF